MRWRSAPEVAEIAFPTAEIASSIFESARSRNPALKASYNVFRKLNLISDRGLQYYWRSGSELKLSFLKTLYEAFKAGSLIWSVNLQCSCNFCNYSVLQVRRRDVLAVDGSDHGTWHLLRKEAGPHVLVDIWWIGAVVLFLCIFRLKWAPPLIFDGNGAILVFLHILEAFSA